MFRLLITGSRDWPDVEQIWYTLNRLDAKLGARPATLIHGGARGVDQIAAGHWISLGNGALRLGDRLTEFHEPRWYRPSGAYDPTAGHKRNQKMVDSGANLCLAFSYKNSPGTRDCIKRAQRAGIRTIIWRLP